METGNDKVDLPKQIDTERGADNLDRAERNISSSEDKIEVPHEIDDSDPTLVLD